MAYVATLCAAYALYCLVTNPAGPITTPDSLHYLNGTPIVPLGYPLFLKLTGARGAIVVQPVLYAAALAWLGREVLGVTRSLWPALLILAGCMVVPQIRDFHASILSESLFLTLLIAFLSLAVRFANRPAWQLIFMLSVAAGLAATVRRTAFAFVPVVVAMVLMHRPSGSTRGAKTMASMLVAALLPFVMIAGAEQIAAPIVHSGAASSLLGRHLFAKAALIEAPPAPPAGDPIRAALDRELELGLAPIRRVLANAPPDARDVLTIYYETCLQGGCADQARASTGDSVEARQTQLMGEAGLARIRRAPLAFVDLTWRHYRALWTYNRLRHPDTAAALNAFLAAAPPLPYEDWAIGPGRTLVAQPSPSVRYAQYALTLVAMVTGVLALGAIAAAAFALRLPPTLAAAGVSALTAHGGLLLTAALAAGFTRFLLGLWPAVVVALGLAGYWALMFGRPLRKTNF